ncbi:hypothetical protein JK361_38640 [Streptomyces sp. 5-8]|uniref:Uncharacterized protein n=1 Tax=Streptomyces musisoli TaxID=2802280 RepID=A0ABS1PDE6_9ACTN|nr:MULTISPECIES: hypothetical protein [Streptomyces]MBL1110404.1 hypothetical protein [Streptomyces musisoli]MBY8846224.1 hypothetical protein [Streptomyces sp. SP2-10]
MTVLAAGLLPAAQTAAVAAAEWLAVTTVRWAQELACDSGLAVSLGVVCPAVDGEWAARPADPTVMSSLAWCVTSR